VRAGLPAALAEDYFGHPRLQQPDAALDETQQVELLRWEYQQRWKAGERARRADYQSAFPRLADALVGLRPRGVCPRCRRKLDWADEAADATPCPQCGVELPFDTVFPRRPAPAAGPVVLPGYEILDELGRGGRGVVSQARPLAL